MLDAIGRTITETNRRISALPNAEKPGKVILTIFTDGLENASHEYTLKHISDLIRLDRDEKGWEFLFLAANQDAIATAEAMSIPLPSAMSYSPSKAGIAATMAAASKYVGAARGGKAAAFSEEDRKSAMEKDA